MRSLAEIVRLRTGACREAAAAITQIAAGEDADVEAEASLHVQTCLRCQAEVAAYQRILRTMRRMAGQSVSFPATQVAEVVAALSAAASEPNPSSNRGLKVAYVGGITFVTAAAGAAGVLVWMSRRRFAEVS